MTSRGARPIDRYDVLKRLLTTPLYFFVIPIPNVEYSLCVRETKYGLFFLSFEAVDVRYKVCTGRFNEFECLFWDYANLPHT